MKKVLKKAAALIVSLCLGAAVIPYAAADLNELPPIGSEVILPSPVTDEEILLNDDFSSEQTSGYTWSSTAGYYLADDGTNFFAIAEPAQKLTLDFPGTISVANYTVQFNAYIDYVDGDCTRLITLGTDSSDAFESSLIVTADGLEFVNNSAGVDEKVTGAFSDGWHYFKITLNDGNAQVTVDNSDVLYVENLTLPLTYLAVSPGNSTILLDNFILSSNSYSGDEENPQPTDEYTIPSNITKAAPAGNEYVINDTSKNYTYGFDFEDSVPAFYLFTSGTDRTKWTQTTVEGTSNKVNVIQGYSLLNCANWLSDYKLKFNMKLDYDSSIQNQISIANLNVQYINCNYDAIILSNDPNSDSGTITYKRCENYGYNDAYQQSVKIDNFSEIFENKWSYVEITVDGAQIKVSINGVSYLNITTGIGSGEISISPTGWEMPTVTMYLDNFYAVKEIGKDYTIIDEGVTIAEPTKADDVIYYYTFEDENTPFVGAEIVNNGTGNSVMKISTEAKLPQNNGTPNFWFSNYKLKYNMLLDYDTSNENGIILLEAREAWWGSRYLQIKLYTHSDSNSGSIVVLTKDANGTTSEIKGITIEDCTDLLKDKWVYVEATLDGHNIKFSINNLEIVNTTLTIDPESGGLGFVPHCDMYIDNFVMYQINPLYVAPDVIPVPEYDGESYIIMSQDYEDDNTSLSQMGWAEIYGDGGIITDTQINSDEANKVFKTDGGTYITRDLKLGAHYKIEFNAKIDYTTLDSCWPEFSWHRSYVEGENRYKIYLGYQGGVQQGLEKYVNGQSSWIDAPTIPYIACDKSWAYFKIERDDNTFKIYFNDKDVPTITFTDESPLSSGGFKIAGSAATMLIDNLLITTTDAPNILEASGSYTKEDNTVICNLDITNNYTYNVTPTVMIAAYGEDGSLKNVNTTTVLVNPSGTSGAAPTVTKASVSLEVDDASAYTYKTFIWDMSDNSPYTYAITE